MTSTTAARPRMPMSCACGVLFDGKLITRFKCLRCGQTEEDFLASLGEEEVLRRTTTCSVCENPSRVVHGGLRYCLDHEPESEVLPLGVLQHPEPPTFAQRWLSLCPGDDESGMVLISEIGAIVRCTEKQVNGKPMLSRRGVWVTLKSGHNILTPDAIYSEVKLAIQAAGVGS